MPGAQAPSVVYRLIDQAGWRQAQDEGALPWGELDRSDGFLHLSTRETVLETAALYFAGRDDLLAAEIDFAAIASDVKFEPAPGRQGVLFPHLFAEAPLSVVTSVRRLVRLADGGFDFGESVT